MTNFPIGLDNLVDPITGQTMDGHRIWHGDLNGAVEALENKLGINNSLDTSSIDYKINHLDKNSVGLGNVDNTSDATKNSAVATLTNKTIAQRVITTTDDASAVIDVTLTDVYELSAIANDTAFTLTGTPKDGQNLIIRFKDAGVAKNLTFTGFTVVGVVLPTVTVAGKWMYVGCKYNLVANTWHVLAVGVEV